MNKYVMHHISLISLSDPHQMAPVHNLCHQQHSCHRQLTALHISAKVKVQLIICS